MVCELNNFELSGKFQVSKSDKIYVGFFAGMGGLFSRTVRQSMADSIVFVYAASKAVKPYSDEVSGYCTVAADEVLVAILDIDKQPVKLNQQYKSYPSHELQLVFPAEVND